MSDKLLDEKLKVVEGKFDQLKKEIDDFQEKVNEGNRQIQARREELVRLQGEYRILQELKDSEKTPAKVEPVKK